MSNAINSKSVSLASIFDPYVAGTTKARASGIDDAGNDTSNLYANIIYGSAAAATGIQSEGADLNTLYAKKGTAVYSILGGVYSAENAGRNSISLTFPTTSTWSITTDGTWNGAQPPLSGSLNTYGTVNEFLLHVVNAGAAGSTLTTAPTDVWTPITAGLLVVKYDTNTLTGNQEHADFTLSLRFNSGPTLSRSDTEFDVWNTLPP